MRGSAARRKGKGRRENKERKERKREKENRERMRRKGEKKRERKEERKERMRGIGTNIAQGAESDDKGLGTALREVSFLLLRLFYA